MAAVVAMVPSLRPRLTAQSMQLDLYVDLSRPAHSGELLLKMACPCVGDLSTYSTFLLF